MNNNYREIKSQIDAREIKIATLPHNGDRKSSFR